MVSYVDFSKFKQMISSQTVDSKFNYWFLIKQLIPYLTADSLFNNWFPFSSLKSSMKNFKESAKI